MFEKTHPYADVGLPIGSLVKLPGCEMWAGAVTITPQLAERWLAERNTQNRKQKPSAQKNYVADMRAGRWRLTHQGIGFYVNHTLADGQHRLASIVESGEPQVVMLVWGLDESAKLAMDEGARRVALDVAKLTGKDELTRKVLEVARSMNSYPARGAMTNQAILAFSQQHYEAIRFATDLFSNSPGRMGINQASVIAVIAKAWYSVDHDVIRDFVEIVETGTKEDEALSKYNPALKLREWILTAGGGKYGGTAAKAVFMHTMKALLVFAEGGEMKKMTPATEDLFPLPGAMELVAAA